MFPLICVWSTTVDNFFPAEALTVWHIGKRQTLGTVTRTGPFYDIANFARYGRKEENLAFLKSVFKYFEIIYCGKSWSNLWYTYADLVFTGT